MNPFLLLLGMVICFIGGTALGCSFLSFAEKEKGVGMFLIFIAAALVTSGFYLMGLAI